MLQKIDCPSYIQTTVNEGLQGVGIPDPAPVAMVPWDQFHTLMTMVAGNNMGVIEVNTLLNDFYSAYGDDKEMKKVFNRVEKYLVEK